MKTNCFAHLAAAAFGLTVFANVGCAAKERRATDPLPSAAEVASAAPVSASAVSAANIPDDATARWSEIKDSTYDTRAICFAGLERLEARVDEGGG